MASPNGSSAALRVGFVGCGRATEVLHLPAVGAVADLRAVVATDPDSKALAAVLRTDAELRGVASFRDLVADPAVDIVAVCVPPALHAEVTTAALAAGKHVYLEKPIAVTLADAAAIRDAVERAPGRLVLGFNLRSHRLVEAARVMIADGLLGEIEMIRTSWTCGFHLGRDLPTWRLDRGAGGGAFYEVAIHHVDLLRYLLADEIESVAAESRSAEIVDQDILINARLRSGALASIAVSQRTADGNDVAIYGRRGVVSFSCYRADSLEFRTSDQLGGGVRARAKERLTWLGRWPAALGAARAGGDFKRSYVSHWQRFASAIRGRGSLPASANDGERALVAVTAALRSVESGTSIRLSDVERDVETRSLPTETPP